MEDPGRAARDRVEAAVVGLGARDWKALHVAAEALLGAIVGNGPADLVQEALRRVLRGTRKWPADTPFLVFLKNVMKSVANQWRAGYIASHEVSGVMGQGNGSDEEEVGPELEAVSPDHSPEELTLMAERAAMSKSRLQQILANFEGNDAASAILMGRMDGIAAEEIRQMFSIDRLRYETASKQIWRYLTDSFPDGWLP